jgi:YidC/Oxa1 family membrane protein insertase
LNIWDYAILQPMINVLIWLSHYLFNSFGLTIIALTLIIRFALLPLTLKQLRATKAMQNLQPKLMELQKKYAKDKSKLAQEQMALYKESGVNPAGCAVPMLIQFPIWIALYQAIIFSLAVSPEALLNLSKYLYNWAVPLAVLPLNNSFIGLNLASPNFVMAILTGVTMWVQQKMVTPDNQDPRIAQQSQMMLWMMPIMFTFFSLSFPSGLALYWVISNVFSIVVQYYVTGWGSLNLNFFSKKPSGGGSSSNKKLQKRLSLEEASHKDEKDDNENSNKDTQKDTTQKEGLNDGDSGSQREDSGGSNKKGFGSIKSWFK